MKEVNSVRLNSEKRIEHKDFKLKLGTTNKNNPLIVYIEGRAFISPNEDKECYNQDITEFKRNLQKNIRQTVTDNQYFQNDYILDFQIANNGVRVGKKSFLSFEFLFKQNNNNILKLKDLKKNTEKDICNIVTSLAESIVDHNFSLYKSKK